MRLRVNGIQVASVNDQLLELYKKYLSTDETNEQLVKRIIESNLLFSSLDSEKNIMEAKNLASNLYYNNIGCWVEDWIRKTIFEKLPICKNCHYKEANDYCPLLNVFVNPYFKSCDNFN